MPRTHPFTQQWIRHVAFFVNIVTKEGFNMHHAMENIHPPVAGNTHPANLANLSTKT